MEKVRYLSIFLALASNFYKLKKLKKRMAKTDTTNDHKNNIRDNWGKEFSLLPKLDLLAFKNSHIKWFLEKVLSRF